MGQLIQANPALKTDIEQVHNYVDRNRTTISELEEAMALLRARLSKVDKSSISLSEQTSTLSNTVKIVRLSADAEYVALGEHRALIDAVSKASTTVLGNSSQAISRGLISVPSDFSDSICRSVDKRVVALGHQLSDLSRMREFIASHRRTPQFISDSIRNSAQSVLESLHKS